MLRAIAATDGARRVPSGPHPRGFPNWDGEDRVWRNDEGETAASRKERRALADREWYERKRRERLIAQQAALAAAESASAEDESAG